MRNVIIRKMSNILLPKIERLKDEGFNFVRLKTFRKLVFTRVWMCLMLLNGTRKCGEDVIPLALCECVCLMFVYEKVQVCAMWREEVNESQMSFFKTPAILFIWLLSHLYFWFHILLFFFSFKIYHVHECEGGRKNSTFDLLALELSAIVRRPRWAWKINWVLCWVQALRSWAISLALLLSSLILPFHVIISIFHYKKRSVFLWFPPLFIYFIADYLVS